MEARVNLVRGGEAVRGVGVDDARQRRSRRILVLYLGGNAVDRVDQHGHGQLMQVAVVEDAAARRYLKGALLLARGQLYELTVGDHLQPEQAPQDDERPAAKDQRTEAKSAAAAVPRRLRAWSAGSVRTRSPSTGTGSLCQVCNDYCCMRTCAITGAPGPRSISNPLSGRTTCPGCGASMPSRRASRSSRFRSQSCASAQAKLTILLLELSPAAASPPRRGSQSRSKRSAASRIA